MGGWLVGWFYFFFFLDHLTAFHLYNQVHCFSHVVGRFSPLISHDLPVGKGEQL